MKEIRTNRLIIEDSQGINRIVLALDSEENPSIVVNDRSGKPRFTLEVEEGEEVLDVRLEMWTGKPGANATFVLSSDGGVVGMLGSADECKAEPRLRKRFGPGIGTVLEFELGLTNEPIDQCEYITIA